MKEEKTRLVLVPYALVIIGCAQPHDTVEKYLPPAAEPVANADKSASKPPSDASVNKTPPVLRRGPVTDTRPWAPGSPSDPSVSVIPQDRRSVDGWRVIHVETSAATSKRVGDPFLSGVWGASPNDVFAVGDEGILLHFDGHAWTAQPRSLSEHYGAVWGHSGEVFVAGMRKPEGGLVRHYDGHRWSLHRIRSTMFLSALWGSGPDNVFAVGSQGAILHYDGQRWLPQPSGTKKGLNGMWGTSATNVFAVGNFGTLLHYDGSSWSRRASGTRTHLRAIWGSSKTNIFIAGDELILHYDGRAWTPRSFERAFLKSIWGTGPANVIAVGANGVIMRFNGQHWSRNPPTMAGGIRSAGGNVHMLDGWFTRDLTAVWTSDPSQVIAVGRGSIFMLTSKQP